MRGGRRAIRFVCLRTPVIARACALLCAPGGLRLGRLDGYVLAAAVHAELPAEQP